MNCIKKKHLLFFLLLQALLVSNAQQFNFRNYSVKNGLSSSVVNNIFQDSRGYLWFATDGGGISRYDYKTFTNYTTKEGLVGNNTTFITEDKKGNVWIATSDGVSQFDGNKFTNYTSKDGLAKGTVYWIHADNKNNIWFAVKEGGLNKFDGKKFTVYSEKDNLISNDAYTISEDKTGNLFIGMSNGILKYNGKHFTTLKKTEGTSDKIFFSSFRDSKNNIWFGTVYGALYKYDGINFTKISLPKEIENDWIGGISEDKKNNIWLATNHGIVKYDRSRFTIYSTKQGLANNEVLSINKDEEGNIWSALLSGASLFQNDPFINYNEKDGLEGNVSSIVQKNNDYYFVSVQNEIKVYSHDTISSFPSIPKFKASTVTYITIDRKQNLWIGTNGHLYKYVKQKEEFVFQRRIDEVDTTKLKTVKKIIEDQNGTIWVATFGSGVIKINNDEIIHYGREKLGSNDILNIYKDSENNIWVATSDAGIIKLQNEKLIHFSEKDGGLANKQVWDIAEDEKHNMYFATADGLSCFDGKKFVTISKKDNLCSSNINSVIWDNSKNCLWIGTNVGINQIKFEKDFKISSINYYGEDQGMKNTEVSGIYKDNKNQLFFYTSNGFVKYQSELDAKQLVLPKVKLTEILLNYDTINWSVFSSSVDLWSKLPKQAILPYDKNELLFKFHAFSSRQNWNYQYKLEGLDNNWCPPTKNPEAVYPNIPPGGNYSFVVRLISSNGKYSEQVLFTFTINPPWWQTWWFYTLSILLIITVIYIFIRYRTSRLKKEKKVLEIKVDERTSELKQTNDQLSLAFNDIKDSINYAKKIQVAILPLDEEIKKALPQSFVLFIPRDVVSGDFYWLNKKDDKIFIAAVDCTGHGVPGAFMSMIGYSLLNEIVTETDALDAATILRKLHHGVRKALKQDRDSFESKDGMDISLAVIDNKAKTLQFAGAKRPLFYFVNGTLQEIKGDKFSIGGLEITGEQQYSNHNFQLKKGDTFYLFTDGYVDQFGGEKDTKYSTKRLKQNLSEIQQLPMDEQYKKLKSTIEEWKVNTEQTDDILVIGFRF